jgi:hypothetical protein
MNIFAHDDALAHLRLQHFHVPPLR